MNKKGLKKQSETNWNNLEEIMDEEIDVSDIPPLGDSFFANAKIRMPRDKESLSVNVNRETNNLHKS